MKYTRILLLGMLAGSATAVLASLPAYDIGSYCEAVTFDPIAKLGCWDMETEASDLLQTRWPQLPDALKTNCDLETRMKTGTGSYRVLLDCINSESRESELGKKWLSQSDTRPK